MSSGWWRCLGAETTRLADGLDVGCGEGKGVGDNAKVLGLGSDMCDGEIGKTTEEQVRFVCFVLRRGWRWQMRSLILDNFSLGCWFGTQVVRMRW